ncbi:MAG: LptF/LptG family permease [Myxococcaceae bacterium]
MSPTIFRYVARQYLGWFAAVFLALWMVFLVADFGDRLKQFLEHSLADIAELYWNKGLVAAHQLFPAAMLLAAGASVTALRRRGEVTAVLALGGSPRMLFGPIALVGVLLAAGGIAFDEFIATAAGRNVDELHVQRFQSWGDYRLFYSPKRWYRVGDDFLFLKGEKTGDVQHDVSLFHLGEGFSLSKRLDAKSMTPLADGRWRLEQVDQWGFQGDELSRNHTDQIDLALPGTSVDTFRIRTGRPEQMRFFELLEQRALREKVGLPVQRYTLALHQRFAYPLTGLVAAMLAVALSLRRERRGQLTLALVEGFFIAVGLWSSMVVFKTLAVSERMPPALAAWAPMLLLVLALAAFNLATSAALSGTPRASAAHSPPR